MKKSLYLILALVVIVGLVYWFLGGRSAGEQTRVSGWVKYSSPSAQTITIEKEDNVEGNEFTLALTDRTKLYNERGERTNFTYFSAGTKLEAFGFKDEFREDSLVAREIRVIFPSDPAFD